MKPALTGEEWAQILEDPEWWENAVRQLGEETGMDLYMQTGLDKRHANAALCLHDQKFGFTREDVALLRGGCYHKSEKGYNADPHNTKVADRNNLADRIEALLPPEEK